MFNKLLTLALAAVSTEAVKIQYGMEAYLHYMCDNGDTESCDRL